MKRIALCLSYNGSSFYGWQAQSSGVPTVQSALEKALSQVANAPIEVVCAGRTDRGVHASHQVVHFDTNSQRDPRAWVFGCNANLPKDISVTWACEVDESFQARFKALSRRYFYCIYNHPCRPANQADEMSWHHYPLDEKRMHEAAQFLVGEHDFSSFRAADCQSRSPNRRLDHLEVFRVGNMVIIDILGNAFLHHMVRNIAGVLLAIGDQRKPVEWCSEVLEAKDRSAAGVTASPKGLYLAEVVYPEQYEIPSNMGGNGMLHALLQLAGKDLGIPQGLWDIAFLKPIK